MKRAHHWLPAILAIAAATAACIVEPAWQAPELLDTTDLGDAFYPAVGALGDGAAVAVWYQFANTIADNPDDVEYDLKAARWRAGAWDSSTVLEHGWRRDVPRVAADAHGHAAILYRGPSEDIATQNSSSVRFAADSFSEPTLLWSAVYDRGGPYEPIFISSRDDDVLHIQVDGRGSFGTSAGSSRFDGTSWQRCGFPHLAWSDRPSAAIDDAGNALSVWSDNTYSIGGDEPTRYFIRTSRLAHAATSWEDYADLEEVAPPEPEVYTRTFVALRPDGQYGLATWLNAKRWRFSQYTPDGGWGPASDLGLDTPIDSLAMDARGVVLTLGLRAGALYTARFDPDAQSWEQLPNIVTAPGDEIAQLEMALEAGGRAVATWTQLTGDYREPWVVRYEPATGWGIAIDLQPPEASGDAYSPHVALDEQGHAFAVWQQSNAVRYETYFSHFGSGVAP